MPEQSIRFGITDGKGNRAATWKCWSPVGVGKNDIYLVCRNLGGALKASLHQSGKWHIAYNNKFFEENVDDPKHKEKGRFLEKWPRPKDLSPGLTLAYRIVTPWSAVNTPFDESSFKKTTWIPNANIGKATEIDILITAPSTKTTGWPGMRSMNTKLAHSMVLDSGETVWIVYWEVEIPTLPSVNTNPSYYKGKSKKDLEGENMRVLVFGNEDDGSRVLYDCALEVSKKGN